MRRNLLEVIAAWLSPRRDISWAQTQMGQPGYASLGWDEGFPRVYMDDEELILFAALIAAAHY